MSRVVAVSGAAGYLGRPLCETLVRRGVAVRALVRDPARFALAGATAARCELPDGLDEASLAGVETLVHGAWATRETDPTRARRVNEEGTRRLVDAARRAGVRRVLFVSTIDARADAPSYYARSKHLVEGTMDPARDLIVRPGFILAASGSGRFQELLGSMRRLHLVPLFGGGRQPLQTVHVDDVCEAIARALERDLTGALNVAEPEPVALGTFLRATAARAHVRCVFLPVPLGPVLAGLRVVERLGIPFPLRSESLLGMRGLRVVPVADDLRRLDLRVRSAAESLADLLP